ncbi:MAG: squalene/phytoene synthase family protein [Gaiellaceae bacterium]
MSVSTELAYEHCRQLVRRSHSSFYAGMRILPGDRREAIFAVYALARRIDDIADGSLPDEEKLGQLSSLREQLERIEEETDDRVLAALADASRRYPIPLAAFGDLIDGAEMDVRGRSYSSFPELVEYCRCVAGSIGRLSLGVFVTDERERANSLADDLGVALQITNILRDLREDTRCGRRYVPEEDLERFGCRIGGGRMEGPVELVVAYEAERGLDWLGRGLGLVPLLDRRSAACVLAMAGAYQRLLERIASSPERVLEGRMSLGRGEKARLLARSLLRAAV